MAQYFDPSKGNLQLQDPEIMNAQARGRASLDELNSMRGGSQMAQALRDSQATTSVLGGVGTAAGPTALNAIGTYLQRKKGNDRIAEMEAKSAALRGDIEAGRRADMQAKQNQMLEQRAYQEQQNKMQRQYQVEDRDMRYNERQEMLKLQQEARQDENLKGRVGGEVRLDGLTSPQKKLYSDTATSLLDINHIADLGGALTEEQRNELANPLTQKLMMTATPADYENYVKENLANYSPEVKNFLLGLRMLDTEIRHAFYGSALSKGESAKFDGIATAIDGLNYDSREQRVKNFAGKYERIIKGMDLDGRRGLLEPVKFKGFGGQTKEGERVENKALKQQGIYQNYSDAPEQMQNDWDLIYNITGERDPTDPRVGTDDEEADLLSQIIGGQQGQEQPPQVQPQSIPQSANANLLTEQEKQALMMQAQGAGSNFPQYNLGRGQ